MSELGILELMYEGFSGTLPQQALDLWVSCALQRYPDFKDYLDEETLRRAQSTLESVLQEREDQAAEELAEQTTRELKKEYAVVCSDEVNQFLKDIQEAEKKGDVMKVNRLTTAMNSHELRWIRRQSRNAIAL